MVEEGRMLKHSNVKERLNRLREISGDIQNRRKFFNDFDNNEFLKWTAVSKDDIKFKFELVPGSGVLTELIDWCNGNCKGHYVAYRGDLYFEDEHDAAMFIMVWK